MTQLDILVAFVGKPSAGKSSFLNAISDASAKVGNFPFTTIKPNQGIAYIRILCPCAKFNRTPFCKPRYGSCDNGTRHVPIRMLDVAGLVPGASEGAGLGNQFLDDLRTANALIHVVDVSGTTDAGGKETVGYDPIHDIQWLRSEIHSWIFNNLHNKWTSTIRRHVATKSSIAETLQAQLSGYGTNMTIVNKTLDKFDIKTPLETWDKDTLSAFVDVYLDERFPTVVALNKIDLPSSDRNMDKIFRTYDESKLVLTSALAETFLRKLHKQKLIFYESGKDSYLLREDQPDDTPESEKLKPIDDKTRSRLEKVQDLVLFRYGTTGVQDCLNRLVDVLGLIPVFPVHNINNFTGASGNKADGVFRECFFVKPGTTVRQLAGMINDELEKHYQYAETIGNIRLGEDDLINHENNIISFRTVHHG